LLASSLQASYSLKYVSRAHVVILSNISFIDHSFIFSFSSTFTIPTSGNSCTYIDSLTASAGVELPTSIGFLTGAGFTTVSTCVQVRTATSLACLMLSILSIRSHSSSTFHVLKIPILGNSFFL